MFHQPVAAFIKESIVESGARCDAGELILPLGLGNQASWYLRTNSPLPILQVDPLSIKSLDQKILFHVKELVEGFASKIEQFGKYFALNTL